MTTRKEIISAARECLGTPFRHQGRLKDLGLDCVGLVRYPIIATAMDGYEKNANFTEYGRNPVPKKMRKQLEEYFIEIDKKELRPGDIIWLKIRRDPQHLAIYTDKNTLIHSVSDGPSKVVEHLLEDKWKKRIYGVFRYRGVED